MAFVTLLQEEAVRDMQKAYDWYEGQLHNLGEEFLEELYVVFDKLQNNPTYYSFCFNEFRKVRLKKFPYLVIYKIEGNKVLINSIRHIKQKPKL